MVFARRVGTTTVIKAELCWGGGVFDGLNTARLIGAQKGNPADVEAEWGSEGCAYLKRRQSASGYDREFSTIKKLGISFL
ncbi:hypothetical protein J1N35_010205 [Gossypium stocksii]|uniref:Uncharacterized protein n=1 Tax=Gossypium stocksii TaxID=47602 RepID=A0A9D4AAB1_9ROSI|nr:hypothetical protein J1N35_010205 [Gossypium stocksii]